jgi:hypothetical protein
VSVPQACLHRFNIQSHRNGDKEKFGIMKEYGHKHNFDENNQDGKHMSQVKF